MDPGSLALLLDGGKSSSSGRSPCFFAVARILPIEITILVQVCSLVLITTQRSPRKRRDPAGRINGGRLAACNLSPSTSRVGRYLAIRCFAFARCHVEAYVAPESVVQNEGCER